MLCDDQEGGMEGAGKEAEEGGDVCTHVADSLCCAAETNTPLQSNYTPVNFFEVTR